MASAWEQLGELRAINQRLRRRSSVARERSVSHEDVRAISGPMPS